MHLIENVAKIFHRERVKSVASEILFVTHRIRLIL